TAVHLLSAAAIKTGLADDPEQQVDLDEARKLINALAGLVTAAAPEISDMHARSLRDGLRSVQLAFREASVIPDPIGKGPGEKWTGPVNCPRPDPRRRLRLSRRADRGEQSVAHLATQHLADQRARQVVARDDHARHLVGREVRAAEVAKGALVEHRALAQ